MLTKYDAFEYIWFSPRKTLRYLWDCPLSFHVYTFIGITCLYGLFLGILFSASLKDLAYLIAFVGIGLWSLMVLLLLPLVSLVAKVLGGNSTCAWIMHKSYFNYHKNLPKLLIGFIWTFVVWVPAAFLFLAALLSTRYMPIAILLVSMSLAVFLYGLFILVLAISEAKNIGMFRSFLALGLSLSPMLGLAYVVVLGNRQLNEWRRLDKESYFHQAAAQGDTTKIKWFLENGADVNQRNKNGLTPLFFACMLKNPESSQLLIENGAGVNLVAIGGRTPLIVATTSGCTQVVELLVSKGAEIDHKNNEGQTALMLAVEQGNADIVKLLLEKGAEVNCEDNQGKAPLHYTVYRRGEEIAQLLLDKGAQVNHQDEHGRTALHNAVLSGSEALVWLLLCRGADANQKDSRGNTSLSLAPRAGRHKRHDIENMLKMFGACEP